MGKVLSLPDLLNELKAQRNSGRIKRKIVFTNGCFDILHVGHARYLKDARALGDILVVGVNTDASVRRLKGPERPIQCEDDRAELLASLAAVDYVVLFDQETPLELVEKINPDVLVKGGDWPVKSIVGADHVLANGGEVKALPFHPGRSTTNLVEKIRNI